MIDQLKGLFDRRFRISTQLYVGIGGAVALTFSASLIGWISFDRVGDAQSQVNEESIPALAAAFGVSQQSAALVAAAPSLTVAATPEELTGITDEIAEDRTAFEAELDALTLQEDEDVISSAIRESGNALFPNIEAINDTVLAHFEVIDLREERRVELASLRDELTGILVPAIDDQLFFAMTGYRNLGEPPAPRAQHFSEEEFNRYRFLAELKADADTGTQLLATAFNISDAPLLEPERERFEATANGIERRLGALGATPLRPEIEPLFERLIELGIGPDGIFNLRVRELELARNQQDLLADNRDLASELLVEAEDVVVAARASAEDATMVSARAMLTGRNLLLTLSGISVVGAVLISWLFVGRVLLRRLGRLSDRMQRMAAGDLEEKVVIDGRDEVAEMATALEHFRRNALEVQRLNLVEKLAEELRGKNEQLETALGDLEKAQDQIVMQEKLAALGELTAGVAHEIRNPLNFIKNFAEVSEELLDELLEEVGETPGEGGGQNGDEPGLIQEIGGDLTSNLKRIREHGERANRIVQSMLMMGRGSGERRAADINALLEEHARLAYHSARSNDPQFRLDLKEEFDPEIGELDVIPQDLGRVFLNMVSNACYATDAKRRELDEKEGAPKYEPTLLLATRSIQDRIEVRIRDNGSGIPPEVVDKIFNPFFTTKPTDKGTGLGLALSSDIVRQHGGRIRVESEAGEFTEMIVELPRTFSPPDGEAPNHEGPEEPESEPGQPAV